VFSVFSELLLVNSVGKVVCSKKAGSIQNAYCTEFLRTQKK